jgi:hypothetical protein
LQYRPNQDLTESGGKALKKGAYKSEVQDDSLPGPQLFSWNLCVSGLSTAWSIIQATVIISSPVSTFRAMVEDGATLICTSQLRLGPGHFLGVTFFTFSGDAACVFEILGRNVLCCRCKPSTKGGGEIVVLRGRSLGGDGVCARDQDFVLEARCIV